METSTLIKEGVIFKIGNNFKYFEEHFLKKDGKKYKNGNLANVLNQHTGKKDEKIESSLYKKFSKEVKKILDNIKI